MEIMPDQGGETERERERAKESRLGCSSDLKKCAEGCDPRACSLVVCFCELWPLHAVLKSH